MLSHYLGNFGDVYHLHSRQPPEKLTNTGYDDDKTYAEWFSDTEIPESDLHHYKVIFLYRNPVDVIYSRYINSPAMLKNVQCADINVTIEDCIREQSDLFGLSEFFDNYTNKVAKNYPIYCVKYEEIWNNMSLFNQVCGIPSIPALYPVKLEKEIENKSDADALCDIYQPLSDTMARMKCIELR
jgi:hypothetical protein